MSDIMTSAPPSSVLAGREILFEFRRHGYSVKVSAIDSKSGTEICIIGPATLSPHILKQRAVAKLAYVMKHPT